MIRYTETARETGGTPDRDVREAGHRPKLKWIIATMRVQLASSSDQDFRGTQEQVVAAWESDRLLAVLGPWLQALLDECTHTFEVPPIALPPPHPATRWTSASTPPATTLRPRQDGAPACLPALQPRCSHW